MNLTNLSLSARIYGAFGTLVLLLGVVGGVGFVGVQTTAGLFETYRGAARETSEIHDYLADVSSTRIAFLNYLVDPSTEEEAALVEWIQDVATTDADGLAVFATNPAALDAIAQVTELANRYLASFEELVAVRTSGDTASAAARPCPCWPPPTAPPPVPARCRASSRWQRPGRAGTRPVGHWPRRAPDAASAGPATRSGRPR